MPPLLSRYQHYAFPTSDVALPLAALIACALAYAPIATGHQLLTTALAWTAICIYTTVSRVGNKSLFTGSPAQKLAWAAGALLALVTVSERAVGGRSVWWAKGVLPLVLHILIQGNLIGHDTGAQPVTSPGSPVRARKSSRIAGTKTGLTITALSAVIAISTATGTISSVAVGLSNAIIQALSFSLVERARLEAANNRAGGGSVIYSASGLLTQPTKPEFAEREVYTSVVRDVAAAGMLASGIAAFTLEHFNFATSAYSGIFGTGHSMIFDVALSSILNLCAQWMILLTIQLRGALTSSFVPLGAATISQLFLSFSLGRLWFAALCAAACAAFLDDGVTGNGSGIQPRFSRVVTLIALLSFGVASVRYIVVSYRPFILYPVPSTQPAFALLTSPPPEPLAALDFSDTHFHPISQLIHNAEASWVKTQQGQSQTLGTAVAEYKRRYGIPPPPHFDKWFEFAKRKNVQIIDDYDSIYNSLMPFWALPPATIRARTRETLGFQDNQVMAILIRGGEIQLMENGPDWQREAMMGMTANFIEFLPDMDLAFNLHDEPRVVVPHDELSRLVSIALTQTMPKAREYATPRNAFSARAPDMDTGRRLSEFKTTRFNVFAHQPTWLPSRLSCSPDSPARALIEGDARDNLTTYAASELGFVYNHTAFSDVCNSPTLSTTHGFFDRPNAFNVVHDLFPIFSQSKMSSFQDILYPSPWYWFGKVEYEEKTDPDWQVKADQLWWRGSTTGGFSRAGGWRRQHRQHMVQKLNALDKAKIIEDTQAEQRNLTGDTSLPSDWQVREVDREQYASIVDVHFSHVGQCDPGDCDAQREFFRIAPTADQQEAWKFKYLLDMDGNAFSGRFYAFLRSRSLPFKMALFREWHEEWIKPWVHYVPLSLRADDALEAVRYLSAEPEGQRTAMRLAEAGRDWAGKALRNADLEAWLFRLLLEYGRLVDDNRETIGFDGA